MHVQVINVQSITLTLVNNSLPRWCPNNNNPTWRNTDPPYRTLTFAHQGGVWKRGFVTGRGSGDAICPPFRKWRQRGVWRGHIKCWQHRCVPGQFDSGVTAALAWCNYQINSSACHPMTWLPCPYRSYYDHYGIWWTSDRLHQWNYNEAL